MKEEFDIADRISEANKKGICTRGIGTFGCACPECIKKMQEFADQFLADLIPDNKK